MTRLLAARGAALATNTVPRRRKRWALAVAAAVDLAQVVFMPLFVEGAASPFDLALDAATAITLLFLLGFRWRLALALATELVPGVDAFPTWTALVATLSSAPDTETDHGGGSAVAREAAPSKDT